MVLCSGSWENTIRAIHSSLAARSLRLVMKARTRGSASSDGCRIYLYPSSDAPGKYVYGPAWLSVSIETGSTDAVKISGEFVANGAWGLEKLQA